MIATSCAQIYTSLSQYNLAIELGVGNPLHLPVGIDADYYLTNNSNSFPPWLDRKYVIMHGDEQRRDHDLVVFSKLHQISVLRISQYHQKRESQKKSIFTFASDIGNMERITWINNVEYPLYVNLLRNSEFYFGSVYSDKQPAGWTALCESLVLGKRAIIKNGITYADFCCSFNEYSGQHQPVFAYDKIDHDYNSISNFLEGVPTFPCPRNSFLNLKISSTYFYENLKKSL